jgi:DNA-binding SARP family transcriptional activator
VAAFSLRVDALGAPSVRIAGESLEISDQKALALLFYLAITGQTRSRDYLGTLLWSEASDANARHSLRSSLYHLRQALGEAGMPEALSTHRNSVSLRLNEDACDAARFRRLLTTNDERQIADAIALYRGPLLDGFTLADAPVFEDWLRSERAELSQLYLQALDRLATWAETREAWHEAIDYSQRIVQVDTLNEAAQQRLMRLRIRSGATTKAIRQYQAFEAELKRELGINPSSETRDLLQRAVRARSRDEAPSATEPRQPEPQSRPQRTSRQRSTPFVGRDAALDELLAICQEARAGRGAAIILHGERGIGKTRLVSELSARLAEQSPAWTVLGGSCSPFDDLLAYGPFYDAFQSAPTGDLSELLASDREDARAEPHEIMRRVLRSLRLLTHSGPVVVAIDDLHWANSSTIRMFGYLATHLRSVPAVLLGTAERLDATPALGNLLTVIRPHGEAHTALISPLASEDVLNYLAAMGVSHDTAGSLAEWLHARSGGSPFMIGELLAQLRIDGILAPAGSGWRLNEALWLRQRASVTLPETAYDLLSWRLAPLTPDARHTIEVLAVASQPLPFALLQDFPGIPSERALEVMDDLLARGLLMETADGMLTISHQLLAETLLARMSQLRKRALHQQLLEAIERCPALQARFPRRQVALHAVAAEDSERARHYGLPALDELMGSSPCAETLSFAQRLYDLLQTTAQSDTQHQLSRALAQLHESLGQLDAAKHWRERQLAIASETDDITAQAAANFDMSELALVSSDYQTAITAAETGLRQMARPALPESPSDVAPQELSSRGYRLLGAAFAMEGSDLSAAEAYLEQAAAAQRGGADSTNLCATLFELGNVAAQRGDIPRALVRYEEASHAAESAGVTYYEALAHNNFAYHSLLLGQSETADRAATRGLRTAETHELVSALVHLYSTLGEIRLYEAEWARAEECFERGLDLAEELQHQERQAGYKAGLALAARGQRHNESALALFQQALALTPEHGHWHLRARIEIWIAETRLARGELAEARHFIEHALQTALAQDRSLLAIHGERVKARILAAAGEWIEASAFFGSSIHRARKLSLSMEVARSQAAWGQAILSSAASTPHVKQKARQSLGAARRVFAAHDARADLLSIDEPSLTSAR